MFETPGHPFSLIFLGFFNDFHSWAVLGGLGRSWVALGSSWGGLGSLLGGLGSLLGRLGSLLGRLGAILGRSWVALGSLLGGLGAKKGAKIDQDRAKLAPRCLLKLFVDKKVIFHETLQKPMKNQVF